MKKRLLCLFSCVMILAVLFCSTFMSVSAYVYDFEGSTEEKSALRPYYLKVLIQERFCTRKMPIQKDIPLQQLRL